MEKVWFLTGILGILPPVDGILYLEKYSDVSGNTLQYLSVKRKSSHTWQLLCSAILDNE